VDYFGFWCEKFIKAYGKKKEDILISTGTEWCCFSFMPRINMISPRSVKGVND
jgi:hypothetical protein